MRALFLLFFVVISPAYSQVNQQAGEYWQALSPAEKLVIVSGMIHGQASIIFVYHVYGDAATVEMLIDQFSTQLDCGAIVARVDEFYSDLENYLEPLYIAYLVVTEKIQRSNQ